MHMIDTMICHRYAGRGIGNKRHLEAGKGSGRQARHHPSSNRRMDPPREHRVSLLCTAGRVRKYEGDQVRF